jgi:hypothetical protein
VTATITDHQWLWGGIVFGKLITQPFEGPLDERLRAVPVTQMAVCRVDGLSFCPDESSQTAALLAAAATEAIGTLDDIMSVAIDVGDETFEVEPRFVDGAWRATLL